MLIKTFLNTLIFLGLTSCYGGVDRNLDHSRIPISNAIITGVETAPFKSLVSKTVYVPIYSNLLDYDSNQQISLQAILSLRNTDMDKKLRIESVIYYDTNGEKIKDYLSEPIIIKPLGSHELAIKTSDLEGGSGAKFLIKWQASEDSIQKPLIEVVTTGFDGSRNISFTSRGVTLK